MTEEWRKVEGFDQYEVSNCGKVRSLDRIVLRPNGPERRKGRMLRPLPSGRENMYHSVELHQDGLIVRKKIHRLVAQAFIENPENKPQVNHLDGNTVNNVVTNLEWVTALENIAHAIANGFIEPRAPKRKTYEA